MWKYGPHYSWFAVGKLFMHQFVFAANHRGMYALWSCVWFTCMQGSGIEPVVNHEGPEPHSVVSCSSSIGAFRRTQWFRSLAAKNTCITPSSLFEGMFAQAPGWTMRWLRIFEYGDENAGIPWQRIWCTSPQTSVDSSWFTGAKNSGVVNHYSTVTVRVYIYIYVGVLDQ